MTELTDVMSEAVSGNQQAKTPEYVDLLARDLSCLLDVGFALRSIPENEIVRWFEGNSLLSMKRPHKDTVVYTGRTTPANQPVKGITYDDKNRKHEIGTEYEVEIGSRRYCLVVHPRKDQDVVSNEVEIKFTKTYAEGKNPERGIRMNSKDKNVLYLLPMVAHLPLKSVSYHFVDLLFKKINGWRREIGRPEQAQFCDSYLQDRTETGCEQLCEAWKRSWMDVEVNVYNLEKSKEVRLDLVVTVPKKTI